MHKRKLRGKISKTNACIDDYLSAGGLVPNVLYFTIVLTGNVQHDIVLQVACEKMVIGPDLLANLRNTAGK